MYVPFGAVRIGSSQATFVETSDEENTDNSDIRVAINASGEYGIYAGTGLVIDETLVLGNAKDLKIVQKEENEASYWTIVDGPGNIVSEDILIYTKVEEKPESDESESKSEAETESEAETKPETEAETESESTAKSESKSESKQETKPTETPGTGDLMPVAIMIGMMMFSLMLMIGMFVFWKRRA